MALLFGIHLNEEFVPNQRIIFVVPETEFKKKVKNLTAVIPYSYAVSLQFSGQIITMMLPQAHLKASVFQLIH